MSDTDFLNIAVLTVSDTRTLESDSSGQFLANSLTEFGHRLADRKIIIDNCYQIRALVAQWIADESINAIIITGGTGVSFRDVTPEAVEPLLDKIIPGFGEVFRHISLQEIGTSTIQSRAFAGISNKTLVFCVPGSTNACKTAWNQILMKQLDINNKPCNFVELIPKF